jgi:hypothetical protein
MIQSKMVRPVPEDIKKSGAAKKSKIKDWK